MSKGGYSKGGYFPTMYSHNPHLVIGQRTQDRNRFLTLPTAEPSNTDRTRSIVMDKFTDVSLYS